MNSKYCLLKLLFMLFCCKIWSQSELGNVSEPTIGHRLPSFVLANVEYYEKPIISLADFSGKWLIIDFWYRGCVSCIKSFPKIDSLQRQFKGRIQFVLVGVNDERAFGKGIRPLYERLRIKQNLALPIAYDSVLKESWNVPSYPHLIMVNPSGIVVAITGGEDVTEVKLRRLLEGKEVAFSAKTSEKPSLKIQSTNGSDNMVLFRSTFSNWNGEVQNVPEVASFLEYGPKNEFSIAKVPLEAMYNLAYFGKWQWSSRDSLYDQVYPYPILEVRSKSHFVFDFQSGGGLFNYKLELSEPFADNCQLMKILQQDLQRVFGYEVSIERRMMPVWTLTAGSTALQRLRTRGEPSRHFYDIDGDGGAGGFKFKNYPISHLMDLLRRYLSDSEPPFFDETGITTNIDIDMDVLMTDRDKVVSALRKYDINLLKTKRSMTVMVIKDDQ